MKTIIKKLEDCTPEEIEIRQREAHERACKGYAQFIERQNEENDFKQRVEILWADYLARQEGK